MQDGGTRKEMVRVTLVDDQEANLIADPGVGAEHHLFCLPQCLSRQERKTERRQTTVPPDTAKRNFV